MIHDEEDNIISTDMYVKQQNYNDVTPIDDIECHVTSYDKDYQIPTMISTPDHSNYGPWSDNAHLVFDVPRLPEREW
jgi:hypothetical protein